MEVILLYVTIFNIDLIPFLSIISNETLNTFKEAYIEPVTYETFYKSYSYTSKYINLYFSTDLYKIIYISAYCVPNIHLGRIPCFDFSRRFEKQPRTVGVSSIPSQIIFFQSNVYETLLYVYKISLIGTMNECHGRMFEDVKTNCLVSTSMNANARHD